MIKRLFALVIVTALAASACGSDATETADATSETTSGEMDVSEESSTTNSPSTTEVDQDFSGDDSGDFCKMVREFEENDLFDNFGPSIGPEFFEEVEALYGEVISIAPTEIRPDFEASLEGIREMGALFAKYEYNFLDENLGAEMDVLSTSTLDAPGERIEAYLEEVCGIEDEPEVDTPGALDGLLPEGLDPADLEGLEIDPDLAQSIFDGLGIDQELAVCLEEELGSEFDIDSAGADPSFLTKEICGTTILEIISGIGQ
ncbi:MAG: hypothetical protein ACI81L_001607 [Verrucomicrobiales bacterium]|jgi:hypothetical protein